MSNEVDKQIGEQTSSRNNYQNFIHLIGQFIKELSTAQDTTLIKINFYFL